MNTKTIKNEDFQGLTVSSLPTCPTADPGAGGYGFSASKMKAAFDALPLFIIERLNALIDDITAEPDQSVAGVIKTGIREEHTLSDLFGDVTSGALSAYMRVGDRTLAEELGIIRSELAVIKDTLGMGGGDGM